LEEDEIKMSHQIKLSRRQVLRLAALGAISAFITACQRAIEPIASVLTPTPAPTKILRSASDVNSIPITSNKDFYITSISSPPAVPQDWKLAVTGLVDKPLALSLVDIRALPAVTEMRTLSCISNPIGGDLISNAVWKGVRLQDVLTQAGVQTTARFLKLEALDGWSTGIPLELGMHDHSLLAYEMNGEPLPPDHGAPLRCLFPGRFGMKQPKFIKTITLVDKEYAGYWEKQGWSGDAFVLPYSRINSPIDLEVITGATLTMSGIAHAGASGLAKLEIGWDDLNQWETADLTRGPNPYVWCVWKWTGKSLSPGRHTLYARATDGNGKMQVRGIGFSLFGETYPDGTDQMHSVVLEFKG
jgi:DMSO/TMAO reductase YedYZ molybdopterin-dependent catalytic subunit